MSKISLATEIAGKGPLKCRRLAFSIVSNKQGLEVGGPSAVFRKPWYLPVYDKVAGLDCCDFQPNTTWSAHSQEYRFSKRRPRGRMYFCEGAALRDIPSNSYDFLLSSHNLEHMANPIRALQEWQRVVKPGGHLLIVLPDYARTFDATRTPTAMEHIIQDYDKGVGEDDLTHVDEILASRSDGSSQPDEELRRLLLDNFNHRMIHHHVFDSENSRQLLEVAGLKVLTVEVFPPFHIFLIGQLHRNV